MLPLGRLRLPLIGPQSRLKMAEVLPPLQSIYLLQFSWKLRAVGLSRSLCRRFAPPPPPPTTPHLLPASRTREADHANLLSFPNNELGQISR